VIVPLVDATLREAGYPAGQAFAVVSHSLGGLIARFLLEAEDSADAGWRGRVRSLVMLSTPHHGVRTGLAAFACRHYRDRRWRQVGCDMRPRAPFLRSLGARKPSHVDVPYLSIGVESPHSFLLVPRFDGDGDGRARGNDNTVMAESAALAAAPFALWRGKSLSDHFTASCSSVVNGWIADFLQRRELPRASGQRVDTGDDCAGASP
jgi:hypothetical protein